MSADTGDERPDAPPAETEEALEAAEAGATGEAPEAAEGSSELEALRAERDELYQRLQRVSAEFDNFQKRMKRERARWKQESVRDLVETLLPVLDNLDYAVAAFDREKPEIGSLRQGVELVREQFHRELSGHGVEPITAEEGTPYDPDKHQAIGMQEVEGVEQEEVAYLARPGYAVGEAVLRPAQVGVRKPAPTSQG